MSSRDDERVAGRFFAKQFVAIAVGVGLAYVATGLLDVDRYTLAGFGLLLVSVAIGAVVSTAVWQLVERR